MCLKFGEPLPRHPLQNLVTIIVGLFFQRLIEQVEAALKIFNRLRRLIGGTQHQTQSVQRIDVVRRDGKHLLEFPDRPLEIALTMQFPRMTYRSGCIVHHSGCPLNTRNRKKDAKKMIVNIAAQFTSRRQYDYGTISMTTGKVSVSPCTMPSVS